MCMWIWVVDGAIVTSQLRLDARLEARLGLGHELGAHIVPVCVVGGRDGHGGVREVADCTSRGLGEGWVGWVGWVM